MVIENEDCYEFSDCNFECEHCGECTALGYSYCVRGKDMEDDYL